MQFDLKQAAFERGRMCKAGLISLTDALVMDDFVNGTNNFPPYAGHYNPAPTGARPWEDAMPTLTQLAKRVTELDANGLSALDAPMLTALTDLGNAASSIVAVAEALQALEDCNQFDASGTDCEALAEAKKLARRALRLTT